MNSQHKKGVFIGLTGIDYVYYIDVMPEENSKCKTNEYATYVGGPAANAAITYAALGGDATLISAYGSSHESSLITSELTELGIKVINVALDNKLPGISTICITKEGKRSIISGQNQYEQLNLSGLNLDEYDFALFDCNQPDISLPLLEQVSCDIILDAGSYKENTDKYLKKANIIISSEQFKDNAGRNIFDMTFNNDVMLAMTRGEKSILTRTGEIAIEPTDCVDSLAAGDIFHGAFCYAFYEKEYNFEHALKYASEIASRSVRYKGPRMWMKQE